MKAAVYDEFQGPIEVREVPDAEPPPTGVVLRVKACGICRSDWHGWMGNDPDIKLPHVPGHELAGEIVAIGSALKEHGYTSGSSADSKISNLRSEISDLKVGDRVTLPFVSGCGKCEQCVRGDQQICDHQFQPGFTAWGGFADYVALNYAVDNLVRLPDDIDFVTAASLGCRFATSFRAGVDQGRVKDGDWVSVWACGGVGLSAIMIAAAFGAQVIAIDISDEKLHFAKSIGAAHTINSFKTDAVKAVLALTSGGAQISIDALGNPKILFDSVSSLRKRGKHIQVGIMDQGLHSSAVPVDKIIGRELEIIGSHGMQAHRYPEMLAMITDGRLKPDKLIGKTISLDEAPSELESMNSFTGTGVTVIDLN